ncbi:MAG: signal peptidase II [Alphaproteobacteria bacterium]|nr:signal peptidase II [Alphaproteobacteria bacterium]MCW5742136.1 signal peptidase II [Alphaproteobacteria bacterium]
MRAGLILAAITIVADQASKWLLQDMLQKQPVIEVIPGFFNLVMVWNRGISFGMLGGAGALPPWVLSAIAVAICIALFFWLRAARSRWTAWAIGLVIGGAIGNVVDRARWGAVFDFADFYIGRWHWPAFNVADAAIVIGVLALLAESLMPGVTKEKR